MKSNLTLPSSVEERISGWVRIQERHQGANPGRNKPRPTVTLSRQFGCEGFPLALALQALFEPATGEPWCILDKELVDRIAQDEHISPHLLGHLEDPARYLEDFGFHPRGAVTADQAFAKIAVRILHFAREGNVIIVGRGGAILCNQLENCFHFRLEASLDWRLGSLVRRMAVTTREALEKEKAQTRGREHFIREHLGADVADRSFYDAVFNNERHGVQEIAAAILGYVRSGWKGGGFPAR